MNVLANDGVSKNCVLKLEENGFRVIQDKVEQEELVDYINAESIEVLLVRSATKVRKELIDNCPNLKLMLNTQKAKEFKLRTRLLHHLFL